MHLIYIIAAWMERTSIGTAIRDSTWLFPIIETIHIFGIVIVVGSTSILDLRLMGKTFQDKPVSKVAERFPRYVSGVNPEHTAKGFAGRDKGEIAI